MVYIRWDICSENGGWAISTKKLKILHVVPFFYPAWAYGGIPRVVYELSRELVRKGHDVSVFTTDVLDEKARCRDSGKKVDVDGIKVCYFSNLSNALAYHYQGFLPLGFFSGIRHSIVEFDIIHLHGHRNILNSIVHFFSLKTGKPYVFSGHGTVPRIERRMAAKLVFDSFLGNRVLRDASRFIAVSGQEVRQYTDMGVSREKVDVIYNGIDVKAFEVLPKKGTFRSKYNLGGRRIVLYLGKITPRKGIDILVSAFSELDAKNAVLVIAGNDMGFRSELVRLIRKKALADRVIFTGLLVEEDKLAAYVDADLLVYPSIHEIFGLVPFEALMCGTPVIVSDDCGCGDIIRRENIGLAVKYGDVDDLSRAISQVLDDSAGAAERTRQGKKFIVSNLDWGQLVWKYISFYEKVIN